MGAGDGGLQALQGKRRGSGHLFFMVELLSDMPFFAVSINCRSSGDAPCFFRMVSSSFRAREGASVLTVMIR